MKKQYHVSAAGATTFITTDYERARDKIAEYAVDHGTATLRVEQIKTLSERLKDSKSITLREVREKVAYRLVPEELFNEAVDVIRKNQWE